MTCGNVCEMAVSLQNITNKRELINRYKAGTICAIKCEKNYLECMEKTIEIINSFWLNDEVSKKSEVNKFVNLCGLCEIVAYDHKKGTADKWNHNDIHIAFHKCIDDV